MARIAAIALGVSLALALAGGSRDSDAIEQPIALTLRPQVISTRADVRAELRIARDVDNRVVDLAWTSDGGTDGRTIRAIDGDNGPALIAVTLPDTPAAHYVFVATLYGAAGEVRGRSRAEIITPGEGK